jgi:hypothetical protein
VSYRYTVYIYLPDFHLNAINKKIKIINQWYWQTWDIDGGYAFNLFRSGMFLLGPRNSEFWSTMWRIFFSKFENVLYVSFMYLRCFYIFNFSFFVFFFLTFFICENAQYFWFYFYVTFFLKRWVLMHNNCYCSSSFF